MQPLIISHFFILKEERYVRLASANSLAGQRAAKRRLENHGEVVQESKCQQGVYGAIGIQSRQFAAC